jgi:hypothetical protein
MLVHTVMFYLKPELTPERREEFRQSLATLGTIKSMTSYYLGTPAPVPPRPIIDLSFDFAISCVFTDVAAHNAYQVDPIHLAFIETQKACWARVQIYDAQG